MSVNKVNWRPKCTSVSKVSRRPKCTSVIRYSFAHSQQKIQLKKPHDIDRTQCDQIGRFFKVLGDMASIKSSPNAW